MKLLNWQRNELFQELVDAGLNPSDFTEERTTSDWYCIKSKDNPEFSFAVMANNSGSGDNYSASYVPSDLEVPSKKVSRGGLKTWSNHDSTSCIFYFRKWIAAVKREQDAPDLWLESRKALQLFSSTNIPVADRFTIAELGAVQGQLNILSKSFGTSELPEEAKQRLAEIAQTAMLKAETLNKKDWQYWIQGAFSSTVTSLELTEAHIQEVVALIRLAFGGLFLRA